MRVWGLFAAGIAVAASLACGLRSASAPTPAACAPGLAGIDGACVTVDEARAYCGPTARWDGARCVMRECARTEALDTSDGRCAVTKTLRELALRDHMNVDADQTFACHDDHVLVVSAGHLSCLPRDALRPRGRAVACAPGTLDAEGGKTGACVSLGIRGAAGDAYTIDVSRWAALVLGPDGGEGTPEVCGPLGASPRSFGVGPAVEARATLEIGLIFPNNDVTQVRSTAIATGAGTGKEGADAASRAIAPLVEILRAWGGTASVASLTVRVHCKIAGGAPPMAVSRD